jgi:hypothetical protein
MADLPQYRSTMLPGVEGAIANEEPVVLISRSVEDAAGIAFGRAVVQGVNDMGCKGIGAGATSILGITVLERSARPETPNGFGQYESARIMTFGVVWLTAAVAVVAGDPVCALTDGSGKFSNTGGVVIHNARWDTSAAANTIGRVRLGTAQQPAAPVT